MSKYGYVSFSLLFIIFSFFSCDREKELIPAYIHIDKFILTTNTGEGTNSHKITDAWVYVDEQLIGAFELPVTFPVLWEGTHHVRIRAGIKVNGIAATRAPYPFYEHYTSYIDFKPGETVKITPTVKYTADTKFNFMENFDNVGMILTNSPTGSDTSLQQIFAPANSNVFEGTGSGAAYVDNTKILFEAVSNTSYILPKGATPVFLEMNYKADHGFVVGMFIHSTSGSQKVTVLNINPTENWNKIYLYLTPVISSGGNSATDYNIFIGMLNNIGADSLSLHIDNLKLVYF